MEKKEFQAESKHLLEMMIHSIYSQREVFLRELISNASDAMDKLYYLSMTDKKVSVDRQDMDIRIRINKEKRLLRISDRGIGMNAEELEKNLGTIAASGSRAFRESMKASESGESLIGQFGVGFYSAFMVADKLAVISRKYGEDQAYRFDSNGVDGFTIRPYEKKTYGTDVILHIREDEDEKSDDFGQFLREYPLYKLVKKYSDYIRYPIKIYMPHPELAAGSTSEKPEFKEEFSYETVNSMVPLWQRSKDQVTKEEQTAFYKEHFGEVHDPQQILSVNVEGNVTYKALLYIPGKLPAEYGSEDYKAGLELYSANVRIMDSCKELLPEEFNFVRGVVDSSDISLNISREILQRNRQLSEINRHLGKKIKSELLKMLRNDRAEYEKFHENFGHHLKVCAMDEYGKKKDQLGDILLFYSGKLGKMITLEEYLAGMKEDQKYIYYANGKSPEAIRKTPQIEVVRDHDMDVLYFLDQADQFVAQMFGSYRQKPFRSVMNGDLGLEDSSKKETPESTGEEAELLAFIKDCLGDGIDSVQASKRLKSHPVCLSNGSGITFEMERYFRSLAPDKQFKAKYILEVNLDHEALKKLYTCRKNDPEKAKKYCEVLHNQAKLIAGLPIEDPSGYTDLLVSLWE